MRDNLSQLVEKLFFYKPAEVERVSWQKHKIAVDTAIFTVPVLKDKMRN